MSSFALPEIKVSKRKRELEIDLPAEIQDHLLSAHASDVKCATLEDSVAPASKRTRQVDPSLLPGIEEQYGFKINLPPVDRPVRIYCDGIYDLFHFGHSKALEQAKKTFPNVYLLVGVCNDIETHKRKGKTVMTDVERYEAVRHCKWVDEVIESAPWIVDQDFLDGHRIDYVAHDAEPYQSKESGDVYAFVKEQGRFLPTERTNGISTSDLITRIVRDYDSYLRRNLERGVSAKELNISFLKERKIKTKKSIEDLRQTIKLAINGRILRWEDKSLDFIRGFSEVFGVEDVLDKLWKYRNRKKLLPINDNQFSNQVQFDDDDDENQ